jgi:hypothetical protein
VSICEYQFASFDARGNEDYLDRFATQLDALFQRGWTMADAARDGRGWGQGCLYRERKTGREERT